MSETNLELYKKHRPVTFSQLVGQDEAVQTLADFGRRKALPHCLLLTGPSGCLDGDTVIYDPVDGSSKTVRDRWRVGRSFHVLSLSDDNRVVIAPAMPPVRYPPVRLFRVRTSESLLCVTSGHRFRLATGGYLSLRELCERQFSDVPLLSNWDIFQEAQLQGGPRCNETEADFRDDYQFCPRFYGEQLHWEEEDVLVSVPLQDDVRARTRYVLPGDGMAFVLSHIHRRQFFDHLSMQGCLGLPQQSPGVGLGYSLPEGICVSGSALSQRIGRFPFGISRRDTFLQSQHLETDFEHEVFGDRFPLALFSPVNGAKHSRAIIKQVEDIGKGEYFDFHVPLTNNYWAEGLWHHNCGKTTIARILKTKLKCGDADYHEINTADFRGIDMVREIRGRMNLAPMSGKVRLWLVDEVHQVSKDGMHAMLKMLEDTPSHVYFILATTDPQKLLPTIRTRATEIKLRALKQKEMAELLDQVWSEENGDSGSSTGLKSLNEEVRDKIVDLADGSPRKALVLLNQVLGEEDIEKALAALAGGVSEKEGIDLARSLMNPRPSWAEVAKLLKAMPDLETQAEGIRRLILAYMGSVALGGGKGAGRAVAVIDCFRDNYFDCGKAGLIASCWEVVGLGKG